MLSGTADGTVDLDLNQSTAPGLEGVRDPSKENAWCWRFRAMTDERHIDTPIPLGIGEVINRTGLPASGPAATPTTSESTNGTCCAGSRSSWSPSGSASLSPTWSTSSPRCRKDTPRQKPYPDVRELFPIELCPDRRDVRTDRPVNTGPSARFSCFLTEIIDHGQEAGERALNRKDMCLPRAVSGRVQEHLSGERACRGQIATTLGLDRAVSAGLGQLHRLPADVQLHPVRPSGVNASRD